MRQEEEFRDDDSEYKAGDSKHDSKELDVESDKSAPGGSAKRGPGIRHADVALSANNGRGDGPLKGTIKGDNGVLVHGEKRRLDAHENDVGRNEEEDGRQD